MVVKHEWNDDNHSFELTVRHDIAPIAQRLFLEAMMDFIAEEQGLKTRTQMRKRRGSNGSDSDTDSDDDCIDTDSEDFGPVVNAPAPVGYLYPLKYLHIF